MASRAATSSAGSAAVVRASPKTTVIVSHPGALAAYTPSQRMYHTAMFFPAYLFDPTVGGLSVEHSGPTQVLLALLMALIWGTLAMVFIVPSWAGVMVTNVVKIIATLYVSDAICRTSSVLERSLALLSNAEPCIDAPSATVSALSLPSHLPERLQAPAPLAKVRLCWIFSPRSLLIWHVFLPHV